MEPVDGSQGYLVPSYHYHTILLLCAPLPHRNASIASSGSQSDASRHGTEVILGGQPIHVRVFTDTSITGRRFRSGCFPVSSCFLNVSHPSRQNPCP